MDHYKELERQLSSLTDYDENFPGERNEIRRDLIVKAATYAADEILYHAGDGSVEESDYLLSAVADNFSQRVHSLITGKLNRKNLMDRMEQAKR